MIFYEAEDTRILYSRHFQAILVDKDLFHELNGMGPWSITTKGYARVIRQGEVIYMAPYILNKMFPNYEGECDHKNTIPLDNRRKNLRPSTRSQGNMNRKTPKNNTTGHKGIIYLKNENKKYRMYIVKERKRYVSSHYTLEEAIAARAAMEKYLFGEYAFKGNR